MLQYRKWIENYNNGHLDLRGGCGHATYMMVDVFPELRRVRGFVHDVLDVEPVEHWWCVTKEGDIIDPTAKQFMCVLEYEELDETLPEPTGKCLNCGGYCFDGCSTCCDTCYKVFAASFG